MLHVLQLGCVRRDPLIGVVDALSYLPVWYVFHDQGLLFLESLHRSQHSAEKIRECPTFSFGKPKGRPLAIYVTNTCTGGWLMLEAGALCMA